MPNKISNLIIQDWNDFNNNRNEWVESTERRTNDEFL